MNPDPNREQELREQMEVRIVALLLGESSAFETAEIQEAMRKDASLQVFHDEMRGTIGLVREASKPVASAEPSVVEPKLSPERREVLLTKFKEKKVVRFPGILMAIPSRRWLVPVSLAAMFVIFAGVAGVWMMQQSQPKSRAANMQMLALNNLKQTEGARERWMLENSREVNGRPGVVAGSGPTESASKEGGALYMRLPSKEPGAAPKVAFRETASAPRTDWSGEVHAYRSDPGQPAVAAQHVTPKVFLPDGKAGEGEVKLGFALRNLSSKAEKKLEPLPIELPLPTLKGTPDDLPTGPNIERGSVITEARIVPAAPATATATPAIPSVAVAAPTTESERINVELKQAPSSAIVASTIQPSRPVAGQPMVQNSDWYNKKVEDFAANTLGLSVAGAKQNEQAVRRRTMNFGGGSDGRIQAGGYGVNRSGGRYGGGAYGGYGGGGGGIGGVDNFGRIVTPGYQEQKRAGEESGFGTLPADTAKRGDSAGAGIGKDSLAVLDSGQGLALKRDGTVLQWGDRQAGKSSSTDADADKNAVNQWGYEAKPVDGIASTASPSKFLREENKELEKIPQLGDKPVVGQTFQKSTEDRAKAEGGVYSVNMVGYANATNFVPPGKPKAQLEVADAYARIEERNAFGLKTPPASAATAPAIVPPATPVAPPVVLPMTTEGIQPSAPVPESKPVVAYDLSSVNGEMMKEQVLIEAKIFDSPSKNLFADKAGSVGGAGAANEPLKRLKPAGWQNSTSLRGFYDDNAPTDGKAAKPASIDALGGLANLEKAKKRNFLTEAQQPVELFNYTVTTESSRKSTTAPGAVAGGDVASVTVMVTNGTYAGYATQKPSDQKSSFNQRLNQTVAKAAASSMGPGTNIQTPALQIAGTPTIAKGLAAKEEELEKVKELPAKSDVGDKRPPPANAPTPQPEIATRDNAFSTFSLNVSDVSFKVAASALENGTMPDAAAIRVEEFVNAFNYRDPAPQAGARLAFAWERARYPFGHNRDLLRFSVQTAARGRESQKPLNVVLLMDCSGSMERPDRVEIMREALKVLAQKLQPQDKISVVAFARTARLWVDGMAGGKPKEFLAKVLDLNPQGGTNLEDAMALAYATAIRHFMAQGMNRVILLTDGAANLGNVDPEVLKQRVIEHRKKGIALDCFGIGWEGYNDDLLEVLSHNGDGRYGFLDHPADAAPEFANQLAGALNVAAADVKTQVEFNPQRVQSWRQIGYAKHQLTKEQFRDNTVDAAEIAAAESGNALYVIQANEQGSGPLGVVRVRYKMPETGEYAEQEWTLPYQPKVPAVDQASAAMKLASSAAAYGEWLSRSPYAAEVTLAALQRTMAGVPEAFAPDPRPQKLAWMIQQTQVIGGK